MTPVLLTGGSGYLGARPRAREELGWRPRPTETTIVQTAESLRDLGLVEQQP
jgi:hypothetical protein